jgi:tetratricopeptide (TPR) repeat protein
VDKIVELCGRHTLSVVLLARTANNSALPIKTLYEKLENMGFNSNDAITDKVHTFWHTVRERERFFNQLLKIFNLSIITEDELHILINLSVLPPINIPMTDFSEWMKLETKEDINSLVLKGWLNKADEGVNICMHQVTQEFVRYKTAPDSKKCKNIIQALSDRLYCEPTENPITKKEYIIFAQSLLYHIDENNEKLATLSNNLAEIYQKMGQSKKALNFQLKALKIFENILDKNHPDLANSYSNMSLIYRDIGQLEKALEYQLKALRINEKLLEPEHPTFESSYNNLGSIYESLNNENKALEFYNKSITLREDNITAWQGLERIYNKLGESDKANDASLKVEKFTDRKNFETNLTSEICINKVYVDKLSFFESIEWDIQPQMNILLGRNGYGKTHFFRLLLILLQKDKEKISDFFSNSKENAYAKIFLTRNQKEYIVHRTKTVYEESIGKIPVLGIPGVRTVNKSVDKTFFIDISKETNIKEYGAFNFINEKNDEGRIQRFLYELCVTYLDNDKSFNLEIFNLLQDVVYNLTGCKFKFEKIEVFSGGSAFQIYVITENSDIPILFQKISEGTLSILVIFGLIYNFLKEKSTNSKNIFKESGILFIDEIDAHLHPEWQRKIVPLLREKFPNVQFFLTAHSPLIIGGWLEGEVSVIRKKKENCFTLYQFGFDFIGWEITDLYREVFKVETRDETSLNYSAMVPFKGDIEKELDDISKKETK